MDHVTPGSRNSLYRVPMRELTPQEAVKSFAEVSLGYSRDEAIEEAMRAGGADLSAAQRACPFGVDVPELARLSASARPRTGMSGSIPRPSRPASSGSMRLAR